MFFLKETPACQYDVYFQRFFINQVKGDQLFLIRITLETVFKQLQTTALKIASISNEIKINQESVKGLSKPAARKFRYGALYHIPFMHPNVSSVSNTYPPKKLFNYRYGTLHGYGNA